MTPLRCVYVDLDGALAGPAGSILHDEEGTFSLLGVRALEACARAGVEVVPWSARIEPEVRETARLLGARAHVFAGGDGLVTGGELDRPGGGLDRALALHRQIRGLLSEECIAIGAARRDLVAAAEVDAFWVVANGLGDDPEIRAAIASVPNVRVAEEPHGAGVYEAVLTTLAERRSGA